MASSSLLHVSSPSSLTLHLLNLSTSHIPQCFFSPSRLLHCPSPLLRSSSPSLLPLSSLIIFLSPSLDTSLNSHLLHFSLRRECGSSSSRPLLISFHHSPSSHLLQSSLLSLSHISLTFHLLHFPLNSPVFRLYSASLGFCLTNPVSHSVYVNSSPPSLIPPSLLPPPPYLQ